MSEETEKDPRRSDRQTAEPDGSSRGDGRLSESDDGGDDDRSAPKQGGDGKKGDSPEPPKKPAIPFYKRPVLMAVLIGVAVIGSIAAIVYSIHSRHFVSTDDAFIEGHIIQISPKVSALVVEVKVDDNWFVTRGQPLVKLDTRDFDAALRQAKANQSAMTGKLSQAQSNLKVAEANVAQAQAALLSANVNYENAERDYQRYAALDEGARSRQQFDNSTAAMRSAAATVAQGKARIVEMQAQVSTARSAIGSAEADVENAAAGTHQAELNLSYCNISAPEDGYVTRKTVEPGAFVQTGQALMTLVPKNVWVLANYKETELDHIRPGQPVSIRVDAYPEREFHGKVDSIMAGAGARFSLLPPENATGNYVKVVQRVAVKIDFDPGETGDPEHLLGPGMSVEPEIDVRSALDR